jgi:low affinity Fe/Cu permease
MYNQVSTLIFIRLIQYSSFEDIEHMQEVYDENLCFYLRKAHLLVVISIRKDIESPNMKVDRKLGSVDYRKIKTNYLI